MLICGGWQKEYIQFKLNNIFSANLINIALRVRLLCHVLTRMELSCIQLGSIKSFLTWNCHNSDNQIVNMFMQLDWLMMMCVINHLRAFSKLMWQWSNELSENGTQIEDFIWLLAPKKKGRGPRTSIRRMSTSSKLNRATGKQKMAVNLISFAWIA